METHFAGKLQEVGSRKELATFVSFCHSEKEVNLVVRGDDFIITGNVAGLMWAKKLMMQWYEVKVVAVRPGRPG